jgi:hypothetical protein
MMSWQGMLLWVRRRETLRGNEPASRDRSRGPAEVSYEGIGEWKGGSKGRGCRWDDGVVDTGRTTAIGQVPWARFDDVILGTGLMFSSPHRVLVAESPREVVPVLDEVDKATREGSWAFGYVAYEAAPGLDAGLAVCDRQPDSPPLVWFGLGPGVDVHVQQIAPRPSPAESTSGMLRTGVITVLLANLLHDTRPTGRATRGDS